MTRWRWMALRHVTTSACDGPFGSAIKSDHYVKEGARVVRLGNIGHGQWLDADSAFLPTDYWASLRQHDVRMGDVLLAGLGDDRNSVGRAAVAPDLGPALVKADCFRFRLDRSNADPRFVTHYLCSAQGSAASQMAADGSTRQRLTLSKALSLIVPIPTLAEQRAIADYLDTETARIDALIATKRRVIELINEQWHSLVMAGISGRLTSGEARTRPSGLEWLGDIPADWGTPWLGAQHENQLGKMLNADAVGGDEIYPYVKNTNVQWDRVLLEDLPEMQFDASDRARCRLRHGDLLVCEGGEVGRAAVWSGPSNVFFQKAIHRVRPIRAGNTRFLMYCLWAAAQQGVFRVEGNQSTIVHLTGEKLREHRFPCPSMDEQDRIVSRLDEERARTARLTHAVDRQVDLLIERRQALITAAVTGELAIPGVAA